MRRFLLSALLACASPSAFAQTPPVFRPLDPAMQVTQPKAAAAPARAVMTAPTMPTQAQPSMPMRTPVARNGEIIDSVGGDAIPALPIELVTANGVSYLSGGIGDEEKAQLTSQAEQFNVRLQVTGKSGEYISDVKLALRDAKDTALLNLSDAGPFVYMALPTGSYKLQLAAPNGNVKNMTITIPGKGPLKEQIRL